MNIIKLNYIFQINYKLYSCLHLPRTYLSFLSPLLFSNNYWYALTFSPFVLHAPLHLILINFMIVRQVLMKSRNYGAPHMQTSTFLCYLLRRKYFPLHLVLNITGIFSLMEEKATSKKKTRKQELLFINLWHMIIQILQILIYWSRQSTLLFTFFADS